MVKQATAARRKRRAQGSNRPETIAAIVREQVEIFGSQRKFAKAFGISESRAGKLMQEGKDGLTLHNLLVLAKMSRYSPYVVLEAAGKHEDAALLRDLFGTETDTSARMSPEVRQIATKINRMPEKARELFRDLLTTATS